MPVPPSAPGRPAVSGRDLRRVAVLALVSGAVGTGLNFIRNPPLPWSYRTRAERLAGEIRPLTGEPSAPAPNGAFPRISLRELRTALAEGKTAVIDARPPLFFRAGHLPGARNLPREGFQAAYGTHRPALEQDKDQPVVIYCQGGSCEDSDLIAAALRSLGFSRLTVFSGGWKEWRAAGLPVETGL